MESNDLNQLLDQMEKRLGLKPRSINRIMWENIIRERRRQCQLASNEEYTKLLLTSSDEMQELIERIVVTETWFFRDKRVFDFLGVWFKQMSLQTPYLRILSLACSSGEEPYSIAMALFEAGFSRNAFKIDAVDINRKALAKARLGLYRQNSFRGEDLNYRDRYFDKKVNEYAIKDFIKKQVHFYHGNLLKEHLLLDPGGYHLIFCRNLFIYLDREAQMHVLNQTKKWLLPQGVLIVGLAEMQIPRHAGFMLADASNTCAFILKNALDAKVDGRVSSQSLLGRAFNV